MENQDKYYKGLFFGAVLGAAVGTIMGLLFAPRKGEDTQMIISGKLKRAIDRATELYEGSERDAAYSNEAKHRSQEIIDSARDEARKILDEANTIIRDIRGNQAKAQEN
ncbi:YtxH domain-containing protein [Chlorobaculum sp. MV4-Y]|uniref:YtxH domain-containing protein n=1 Tax=Chlorobaculum sp. MV4-Y TaxID=2976335 RepID=UPI0021B02CD5|nr:YtxH domain-containing protein [Chlorobaculum sp. MV4-Y]UWX57315.1 YtxH domain-containing protein [Chlorobaculum sp. MV4-Y]